MSNNRWFNLAFTASAIMVLMMGLAPASHAASTCTATIASSLANGASTTATDATAPTTGSATVTCNMGVYNYSATTCVTDPNCTGTPWGTIANGASVTAYSATSVACGGSCATVSETRTCTNGVLSGTFANTSCSVTSCVTTPQPASRCAGGTLRGVIYADGIFHDMFNEAYCQTACNKFTGACCEFENTIDMYPPYGFYASQCAIFEGGTPTPSTGYEWSAMSSTASHPLATCPGFGGGGNNYCADATNPNSNSMPPRNVTGGWNEMEFITVFSGASQLSNCKRLCEMANMTCCEMAYNVPGDAWCTGSPTVSWYSSGGNVNYPQICTPH